PAKTSPDPILRHPFGTTITRQGLTIALQPSSLVPKTTPARRRSALSGARGPAGRGGARRRRQTERCASWREREPVAGGVRGRRPASVIAPSPRSPAGRADRAS